VCVARQAENKAKNDAERKRTTERAYDSNLAILKAGGYVPETVEGRERMSIPMSKDGKPLKPVECSLPGFSVSKLCQED